MIKVEWRYCPSCDAIVPAQRSRQPNHFLQIILSLFTLGMWVPFYMVILIESNFHKGKCPKCKGKTQ